MKVRFKEFSPKPGEPGTTIVTDDREFQVWSDAPAFLARNRKAVWALPLEPRDGDAQIYLISPARNIAAPYHADGTECCPYVWHEGGSWGSLGERHEEPCRHRSHKKDDAS
jgi:hypothetical protein